MFTFPYQLEDINYTKTEQKIIDFICQNPNTFLSMPITQLGEKLEISDATLSRFAKHCGYKDYKDLKITIANQLEYANPADKLNIAITTQENSKVYSFLQQQKNYLQKTMDIIDTAEFNEVANTLAHSSHIYIHSKGAATALGELLAFRLNRFGKNVTQLPSGGSELFEGLINIPTDAVVICFGFQSLPTEVQILLKHKQESGYKTILFSSRNYPNWKEYITHHLVIYRGNPKEYHSMTTPIAVIDALVLSIASLIEDSAMKNLNKLHSLKKQWGCKKTALK